MSYRIYDNESEKKKKRNGPCGAGRKMSNPKPLGYSGAWEDSA